MDAPGATCPDCQPSSTPEARAAAAPKLATPATLVLVAINVLVFVAMVAKGVSFLHPPADALLRWGANLGSLTLQGQWWRLFTCMFIHIGVVHLALNMWALWEVGYLAEHLYGPRTFVAVYLLSGVAGGLASMARNPLVVSAGASGAIFGIAGALIATLYLGKIPAERHALRVTLVSLIAFAGYNLAYGFVKGNIDNGAHVGGLVAGLLLGAVLSRDFRVNAPDSHLRRALLPAFGVLLVAGALIVRHVHQPVLRLSEAEQLLARGDTQRATREIQDVIKQRPELVPARLLLANAYIRAGQPTLAEDALQKTLQLDPRNLAALGELSFLYLRSQRFEPARATLQRMSDINPRDPDIYVNLGVTLNQLGRSEEAVAALQKAITLNPRLPLAYFNLGLSAMNLKRFDQAIGAFTQASRLAPNDPDVWIWLANAYQAKGMTDEANQAYAKAYQLRARQRRRN
jgi:membrane associated rhomboid family serine protease/Tfp pilus assembly protein PilF